MRVKLDENFGTRTQDIFRATGHNVKTVWEEELHGCSDQKIFETCCAESRCLVTLDLDFADTVRFQPEKAAGIAVIRVPRNRVFPCWKVWFVNFLKNLIEPLSTKNYGL